MTRHAAPSVAAAAIALCVALSSAIAVGAHYTFATGQLEVALAEDFTSAPIYHAWLRTDAGQIPLDLSRATALAYAGSRVRVRIDSGPGAAAEVVRVPRASVVGGLGAASGSGGGVGATNTANGAAVAGLRVAVLLVNFSNNASQPFTPAAASAALLTNADSVRNFFLEESRGSVGLAGQVFGWYTIPATNAGCDWSSWGTQARAAATAAGVDLSAFSNVVVAWPAASCGWSGLGYVKGPYTFINGSFSTRVVAHELGHNMGLMHANSTTCTSSGARVAISAACTSTEYGDPFSIMGTGASYHDHGAQIGELGWLGATEVQTLTASGTYQLTPLLGSPAGTVHLLRIARGDGTWLYLDYRVTYGTVFDRFLVGSPAVSGVMARIAAADGSPSGSPYATLLVDTTPSTATFWDAPLAVGRSLTDPLSRATITTMSVDSGQAMVRVDLAGTSSPSPAIPPSPTPTVAPTPTRSSTPQPTPTRTPTPTPTPRPTPSASLPPAPTVPPTVLPPPASTATPTATPSAAPSQPPAAGAMGLVKTIGTASLSRSGNTTLGVVVPASGVSAGNTVVVAVLAGTFKGTVACSDSAGNLYTIDADTTSTGRLFVCSSRTVRALIPGDTITVTYPGFSGTTVAVAAEFSGLAGFDQGLTAVGNGPRPSFGPLTTAGSPELLVSAVSHGSTPVFGFGCGFAPVARVVAGAGSGQRAVDLGFQVGGAPGGYSACGTLSPSAQWQGALIAYR